MRLDGPQQSIDRRRAAQRVFRQGHVVDHGLEVVPIHVARGHGANHEADGLVRHLRREGLGRVAVALDREAVHDAARGQVARDGVLHDLQERFPPVRRPYFELALWLLHVRKKALYLQLLILLTFEMKNW